MSFKNLNKDELLKVAEHFAVDVTTTNEDGDPTKKEILAALAEGDDPVTWEQYKEYYLPAAKTEAPKETPHTEKPHDKPETATEEKKPEVEQEEQVLIKYERKNPTYEVVGYRFTLAHPFQKVPASVASHLVRNLKGFRVALPDEVADYYN